MDNLVASLGDGWVFAAYDIYGYFGYGITDDGFANVDLPNLAAIKSTIHDTLLKFGILSEKNSKISFSMYAIPDHNC